jgi:hypothetical protein
LEQIVWAVFSLLAPFDAILAVGKIANSAVTWVLHFGAKGIALWYNPAEFSTSQHSPQPWSA